MSWRIDIPHRGRDQPVIDALCDTNTIVDPEARVTAREILGQAAENGVQTVGQVLDRLEQMTQPQRRDCTIGPESRTACRRSRMSSLTSASSRRTR
jgi:hypothetical protein